MSLNPSNAIAQRTNPGKRVFPNLARRVPAAALFDDEKVEQLRIFREVDAACCAELAAAGIEAQGYECFRIANGKVYHEVPTAVVGAHCGWSFRRAWYYWIAEGPGVPPHAAEEFHQTWGTQCRVEGHCCCPSPLEYCRGFAVGSYHIDTQEGLNAFAQLLKQIYIPREDERERPAGG